ncbi:mini-chromosome maintenance replisome factor-domain-containing protein, partial [Jimgerdemannia flammicorona]
MTCPFRIFNLTRNCSLPTHTLTMPSIDLHNCIQNPLAVVGRLFADRPSPLPKDENWAAARTRGNTDFGVSDHFDRLFDTPDKLAQARIRLGFLSWREKTPSLNPLPTLLVPQIPSLNDTPWRRLRHNTLVRFRCMVQDTGLGQEYFVAAFETTDAVSGVKYTDDPVPEQNDALDTSTIPTDLFGEKQLLYCVSVPAETAWAARAHTGHGGAGRDDNGGRRAEVDEAGTGSFVPEKYPFSGEHHVAAVVK